jgi:hypothetical protein
MMSSPEFNRVLADPNWATNRIEVLELSLGQAVEELSEIAEFMGAEGYFSRAKDILNHLVPKFNSVLGDQGEGNGENNEQSRDGSL